MDAHAIEIYRRHALLLHLTDEEVAGLLDGALEGLTALRVAAHLKRCSVCEARLEFLRLVTAENDEAVAASAYTRTGWWHVKDERRSRLRESLNDASFELDHVLANAAHTMGEEHFKDGEGWFECSMYELNDGTMSVSIVSRVTEEAGSQIDLLCDLVPDWRRTATFDLEGDEIVARIDLTLDDRRQLPRGCQLRCRLRHRDGEPSE